MSTQILEWIFTILTPILIWSAIGAILYINYKPKSNIGNILFTIVCGPAVWGSLFAGWVVSHF